MEKVLRTRARPLPQAVLTWPARPDTARPLPQAVLTRPPQALCCRPLRGLLIGPTKGELS